MPNYKYRCSDCGNSKGALEFYQSDRKKLKDGEIVAHDLRCINCKTFERRLRKMTRPAAVVEREKRRRTRYVKKVYNLSEADYTALIRAQGGKCKLCGAGRSDQRAETLCVDHDHDTGKIRGLLCRSCNILVGHLETRARGRTAMFAIRLVEYLNGNLTFEVPREGPVWPEGSRGAAEP